MLDCQIVGGLTVCPILTATATRSPLGNSRNAAFLVNRDFGKIIGSRRNGSVCQIDFKSARIGYGTTSYRQVGRAGLNMNVSNTIATRAISDTRDATLGINRDVSLGIGTSDVRNSSQRQSNSARSRARNIARKRQWPRVARIALIALGTGSTGSTVRAIRAVSALEAQEPFG